MKYIIISVVLLSLFLCSISTAQQDIERKEIIKKIQIKYMDAATLAILFGGYVAEQNYVDNGGRGQRGRGNNSGR